MESTIAIISLGGKQHLVSQGTRVVVNRLALKEGEAISQPDLLSNRVVQAKVLSHQLGKKINGLKFKAKTRNFKRYGHRQNETTVEITSIDNATRKIVAEAAKLPVKKPIVARKANATKNPLVSKKKITDDKA